MARSTDLTKGNITRGLWGFALPLMLGNVLQQLYNLVDTWVVGRYVGDNALAAVGSSYTLMTFLTSVIIGLCLGSSSFVSMAYGRKDVKAIRNGIFLSSSMIGAIAVVIMALFYILVDKIILLLQVPYEIAGDMKEYLIYVFIGFIAIYIYNYVSNILRGIGNSVVPLVFLSVSVVLNIFLDILFVAGFNMGIKGAAAATVIAQYISGIGIFIYMIAAYPEYRIHKDDMQFNKENITNIFSLSGFTRYTYPYCSSPFRLHLPAACMILSSPVILLITEEKLRSIPASIKFVEMHIKGSFAINLSLISCNTLFRCTGHIFVDK